MYMDKDEIEEYLNISNKNNPIDTIEKLFCLTILRSSNMEIFSESISAYNNLKKEFFPDGIKNVNRKTNTKNSNNEIVIKSYSSSEYAIELENILLWVLGEYGSFPAKPKGSATYWFRKTIRQRLNTLYEEFFPKSDKMVRVFKFFDHNINNDSEI